MSQNDKPDSQSQRNEHGHPLLNALNFFGRSFFPQTIPYANLVPSDNSSHKVITIWERLQDSEQKRSTRRKTVGGMAVKQLEPAEPIDFLEYCRRKN
jgi:hypothetical protein